MVDRANSLALPDNRVVQVDDLTVRFVGSERTVEAVRNLSFHVDRGETLAIVGESGSGKSVTSLALMRLVEHGGGRIAQGSMALRRRNGSVIDLVNANQRAMRNVRGADTVSYTHLDVYKRQATCRCRPGPRRLAAPPRRCSGSGP